MTANPRTFNYLRQGVDALFARGAFRNGQDFRPTQHDALAAYYNFLYRNDLTPEQKLKGFFEIPTGVGKTALFLAILDEAHRAAKANDDTLRAMIIVPTIAILEQMEDEVREWAPDFLGKIGFYGGKTRDMGGELTVITYNSWQSLMDAGEIDSSNIDILVSDEAHRGTSERRVATSFNSFSNGTAQIAFTATARFDDEKSVELSHGHQIFTRGVGESVQLGELAAYIQTQLYIIRVQPLPPQDAFNDAAEDSEIYASARRAGMRQEAWMRQMVAVLRDGKDEHTNDPLTDNKSGFYVSGTEMADRTAELANADSELQARAKAQGKRGVMVSIHSNLHPLEQRARLEAFKRGEYLAAASDTQLKEGHNDKTLKNVFDFPRTSLVDKAQIIGRAARQWWNAAKNRYEGATVIDSIVYIGSDDPKEDERLKEAAIRGAVMAWSVLDGSVAVFTPDEEPRSGHGLGGGGVRPILGLDVTSYINLDDIRAIYARQRKLIEGNRIPLTDEMYEELKNAIERAQISYPKLLSSIKNLPSTVNLERIKDWLRKTGRVATVVQEEWDIVLNAAKNLEESEFIICTKEMREHFQNLARRLRTKDKDFISVLKKDGLTDCVKSARLWYNNKNSIGKVPKKQWELVMSALAPHDRIPLTEEMRLKLRDEMSRVGLSSATLAKALNDNRINESKLRAWTHLKSATKNVAVGEWNFIISSLQKMPDKFLSVDGPKMNSNFSIPSP